MGAMSGLPGDGEEPVGLIPYRSQMVIKFYVE